MSNETYLRNIYQAFGFMPEFQTTSDGVDIYYNNHYVDTISYYDYMNYESTISHLFEKTYLFDDELYLLIK